MKQKTKRSNKIRNPGVFGMANEICSFGFKVNKEDGVIDFTGGPSDPDQIWMTPQGARSLANKLLKAADYLEQEGF